ncbi:MAG: hypothetical protein JXX29_22600 [Deltaproteobacteria bacterium]|nr:hypothetical protein [Deltaproteobacteria bacterium]MBN2674488.1 hypothetical protein [Deltaproteobacteria bacterium]
MKWEKDAQALYDSVDQHIPAAMKQIANPLIQAAAERRCAQQNADRVTLTHLIEAIFEVVPQTFKARMVAILTSLEVDCGSYIAAAENTKIPQTDIRQLTESMRTLSEHLGLTMRDDKLKKLLSLYDHFFKYSPVSLGVSTNSEKKYALTLRYLETGQAHTPDPLTMAMVNDILPQGRTPLTDFFEEAKRSFDVLGYGVEVNVESGMSQIWMALFPIEMDKLLSLKHLPPAAKQHVEIFQKYNMSRISLITFDLTHQMVSLHVMRKTPTAVSPDVFRNLLKELSGIPDHAVSPELLDYLAGAHIIHFTFSWQSDVASQVCFNRLHGTKENVPVQLDSVLSMCVEDFVFTNGNERFIVGVAISSAGIRFLIENDYNGRMLTEIQKGCRVGI